MTDPTVSPLEIRDLRRLVGLMIPAGGEYGVPAADDPAIFADILGSLGRDFGDVRAALDQLATLAGGSFAALDDERAAAVGGMFLASDRSAVGMLGRVVLFCYYRDDRVLRSLGQEPRAPFPQGHVVEPGDWSLLDAVKGRPPLWRDDRIR
jgi:hypothetical protein